MSETTVGSIVGFLRLDDSDFVAAIERALALTDKLDAKRVDVKVDADTAGAEAKLGAVEATLADVDKSNVKVASSSQQAGQGMGALIAAAVTLGPALVPIAGGATVAAAAMGGLGVAGIAAILGIKAEMSSGTDVGIAYTAGIATLKNGLDQLEATAAANVLAPFQAEVARLSTQMPTLNSMIGEFSTVAGRAAGELANGLVTGFIALRPLMQDGAVYIEQLSQRFDAMMSGPGVKEFGDYARSVFPQVMQTVESLVEVAGRLVVALAPLGGASLTIIQAFSNAINAIPLPVLTALATIGPSVFLGFKAAGAVTAGVEGFGAALRGLKLSEDAAALGMRGLEAAAGPIGLAIAAATLALTYFSNQSRDSQQAVNDLTDAFKQSHGAISQQIQDMQYAALQSAGAIDAAKALGLNLSEVTAAATGSAPALADVSDKMKAMYAAAVTNKDLGAGQVGDLRMNIDTLRDSLNGSNTALNNAKQAYADYAAATQHTAGVTGDEAAQQAALAGELGTTTGSLKAAQDAQSKTAAQTAQATLQMRLQNDAAGLLKLALDALNGKVLNVEQAQTHTSQATMAATKAIHDNKDALNLNTTAGLADRAAIEAAASAAQAQAQAVAQQTGSTTAASASILHNRDTLLAQLSAQHLLTPAIQAYIDKLYTIPKVIPTQIEVQNAQALAAIAQVRAAIASMPLALSGTKYAGKQTSASGQADGSVNLAGVTPMAAGDVLGPSRQAMVTSKPILWGEAGPEAYIPLSPSKRSRSLALWQQTGEALGAKPAGATVNQTFIHNTPDPAELAAISSSVLMFQLAGSGG